jgi:hypothetical protein
VTAIRDIAGAQRARLEQMLDKPVRLSSGVVVPRRQWLQDLRAQGAVVKTFTERQYKLEDKVSREIERLGRNVPFGNPNHPDTIHYEREKARLKASLHKVRTGVETPEPDRRFFELNKTELEFFEGTFPTLPPGTTGG